MKANLLSAAVLIASAAMVSSCAEQRVIPRGATAPRPMARPTAAPAAPGSLDWRDRPITPGDWKWSLEGGQSVARFAGGRLVMRCDPAARAITIERRDAQAPSARPAAMTVTTQTQVRSFEASADGGVVAIVLPARDQLLDAMAFSRGRFAVEVPGMEALYVPSWAEVGRVIEDCR